jgi:hypothetical protein
VPAKKALEKYGKDQGIVNTSLVYNAGAVLKIFEIRSANCQIMTLFHAVGNTACSN